MELSVFVSTSSGLVGNENPSCKFLFICGLIHNAIALTQAIDRLRMKQRDNGAVRIFIRKEHDKYSSAFNAQDSRKMASLIPSLFSENERSDLLSIYGIVSLVEWTKSAKCRLSSLAELFGKKEEDCKCCDNCVKKPVNVAAKLVKQKLVQVKSNKIIARGVMEWMKHRCIICKSNCDGEQCLGKKRVCFKCGSKYHYSRNCDIQ